MKLRGKHSVVASVYNALKINIVDDPFGFLLCVCVCYFHFSCCCFFSVSVVHLYIIHSCTRIVFVIIIVDDGTDEDFDVFFFFILEQ